MSKAGEILSRAGFDVLVDDRSTECGESRRLADRLGLPATVWIAESEDALVARQGERQPAERVAFEQLVACVERAIGAS